MHCARENDGFRPAREQVAQLPLFFSERVVCVGNEQVVVGSSQRFSKTMRDGREVGVCQCRQDQGDEAGAATRQTAGGAIRYIS